MCFSLHLQSRCFGTWCWRKVKPCKTDWLTDFLSYFQSKVLQVMVNIFEAANKDGAIWPQSRDNQYSFQTLFTILIPAHQRQQLQHNMLQVAWRDASSQHKVAPGRNWESMCEVPAERGGTEYVCRLVDLANVRKERMARNFSLAEVFPQNKPSWKVAPSIRVKQSRLKVKSFP